MLGVAGLSVASMAVGLGLAFPGGIGSRSGSGAGVSPIYVTPARSQTRPALTNGAAPISRSSLPTRATAVTRPELLTPATPAPSPAPSTTTPTDVVSQVNQQVTDVLDGLIPPQSASR